MKVIKIKREKVEEVKKIIPKKKVAGWIKVIKEKYK
jgi:hypothetical protein